MEGELAQNQTVKYPCTTVFKLYWSEFSESVTVAASTLS